MGEYIFRFQIDELKKIRLIRTDGSVHEMPVDRINEIAAMSYPDDAPYLRNLAEAIAYFSKRANPPIEFVISLPLPKSEEPRKGSL